MVRSDKNPLGEGGGSNEGEEIDRIMKEIEDLEKRMDTDEPAQPARAAATETPKAVATTATQDVEEQDEPETETESEPESEVLEREVSAKVVPMRPSLADSLAETDAVPARDEPLVRPGSEQAEGGLALKIGGCTDVNLEFTRSGISVQLRCSDDGLVITTGQGAEFRIPFKRSA